MNNRQASSEGINITPRLLYDHLSTGDAEYHDAKTMSLVEYDIWNNTRDTIKVVVVSEIKGYSSAQHNTLKLAPGKHLVCRHLPVINNNMINRLRRNTTVSVLTSFSYQHAEKQGHPENNDLSITLMRYNTVLWAVPNPDSESGRTFLLEHIIAWIDPDHELVQNMLGKAYELLPPPKRFGYNPDDYDPENTRAQVEAIYNALRASNKLRYVPTSKIARLGKGEISQVVRRPEDSLNTGFSNCIDGAVLYASLIEAAGLDPVIVIKEGHAFVGWKTCNSDLWKRLRPDERYEFLDTTWTQDRELPTNFQLAWKEGARLYDEIQQNGWENNDPFSSEGFARLLDISSWRRKLERNKVRAVPFLIKDIENPPDAADNGAPGIITKVRAEDVLLLNTEPSMSSTSPDFQNKPFDVFLCHNNKDKAEVKEIAKQLLARGIVPWLDEWELQPGRPWQDALEQQIGEIKSAAVFVGASGFGPWQNMELKTFLREFVRRGCPVIPVILKTAPVKPILPLFLAGMTWVDFRKQEPNPMKQLVWGITSKKPDANDSQSIYGQFPKGLNR